METMRLLVHVCVVLWHELPPDFRRNNIVVDWLGSHDEDCAVSKKSQEIRNKTETTGGDLQCGGRVCRGDWERVDDLEAWSEW